MNKFINKLSRTLSRGHIFGVLVLILVLVVVVSAVFIALLTPKSLGTGKDATKVESTTDNKLVIKDIYEGEREIPKFNVEANTYDMEKFESQNGLVTYPESYIGIDLSEHQGTVDWTAVKESGVDFAIIRVGYRGYTRGRLYDDLEFENNIKGATAAGIKVGVYFFSQAVTTTEAEEEAGYVLEKISGYKVDYPVVFDWEPVDDTTARTNAVTGDVVSDCAVAFCKKVSKAGFNSAVYLNKTQSYEFYDLEKISNYDIWYAEYQEKPSMYYNFDIWQYTANGTIKGVNSAVDVNISFKDYTKK